MSCLDRTHSGIDPDRNIEFYYSHCGYTTQREVEEALLRFPERNFVEVPILKCPHCLMTRSLFVNLFYVRKDGTWLCMHPDCVFWTKEWIPDPKIWSSVLRQYYERNNLDIEDWLPTSRPRKRKAMEEETPEPQLLSTVSTMDGFTTPWHWT